MRRDEGLLRLSVDAARLAAVGEDYADLLTKGVGRILDADAGVGLTRWNVADDSVKSVTVKTWGVSPLPQHYLDAARQVAGKHPSFQNLKAGVPLVQRLSDHVNLRQFWETDTYHWMHSWSDGRYPAGLHLGTRPDQVIFLGLHRRTRDFDDEDMQALSLVREPLASALAFRNALDAATARLVARPAEEGGIDIALLTRRERDVVALVAQGWTNQRIGRRLGISERTVRKHLECARAKVGAGNRAEAAAWWARARDG